ncbi:MAG: hypothetical protein ACRD3E_03070 [Terriglobales bacterium]
MSSAAQPAPRPPNPIGILVRVVVITIAFAVLGLGLGGLFGIVALTVINLTGEPINMTLALFAGGLPGAVIGGIVGLVLIVRSERQALRGVRREA